MAGIGPYIKPMMRMGTPLKSIFKKGGISGSGISMNIKMVEMAAKTPMRVIIRVLETGGVEGLFCKAGNDVLFIKASLSQFRQKAEYL